MARYRRYYRRYVRTAKKKWASNAMDVRLTTLTIPATGFHAIGQCILSNEDRISNDAAAVKSSAQILKTSRFKFRGVISFNTSSNVSLLYFITYVPEGALALFTGNGELSAFGNFGFYTHPEWVMAWGRKDFVNNSTSNEISLTTKLKRNLNSGDAIYFIACWVNPGASSTNASLINGTVSYMCCAN